MSNSHDENRLLFDIIRKRNGHYCHALELSSVSEYKSVINSLMDDNGDNYTKLEYIDFFRSISLHYINDDTLSDKDNEQNENELYAFNYQSYINMV